MLENLLDFLQRQDNLNILIFYSSPIYYILTGKQNEHKKKSNTDNKKHNREETESDRSEAKRSEAFLISAKRIKNHDRSDLVNGDSELNLNGAKFGNIGEILIDHRRKFGIDSEFR